MRLCHVLYMHHLAKPCGQAICVVFSFSDGYSHAAAAAAVSSGLLPNGTDSMCAVKIQFEEYHFTYSCGTCLWLSVDITPVGLAEERACSLPDDLGPLPRHPIPMAVVAAMLAAEAEVDQESCAFCYRCSAARQCYSSIRRMPAESQR